ncbi:MurR/RpiR family transcriptional regulator [Maritalea porphyrae]|uniref:MurR/RpiR family transcriptional regulator n=1 Tax=Maritalea porphyrae TaxID=880732 RepID=UPI0022AEF082|nr:SIS domain-containing protein [Maritalea porphyrae]MCZ4274144.1 SIS domain-containing protein [Maritalea porphyrae]
MHSVQNLISKLSASFDDLSHNERRIAQEILDDPAGITTMTSQNLAQQCGVSQSSIIKFCKKIGLSGFPALKITLSAEIARTQSAEQIHGDIFSNDPLSAVAQKMYNSKVSALSETLKLNSTDDFSIAVEKLTAAKRIIILGVGGSALVSSDFASKLTKLGKAVISGSDAHVHLANLARFGPEDLLVLISYSGKSKELLVAAEYAHQHNIPILRLTGPNAIDNTNSNEFTLRCVASENLVRSSSIATRTAQLAITDLLFILFAQKEADMPAKIQDSQNVVNRLR